MIIMFKSYISEPHSYMQHFLDGKSMTTTKLLKYLSGFEWESGNQIPYFVNHSESLINYAGLIGNISIYPFYNEIVLLPLGVKKFRQSEVSKHITLGVELIIPGITYPNYPDLHITLVYTKQGWMLLRYEDIVKRSKECRNVYSIVNYVNQRSIKFHKKQYEKLVYNKNYKHVTSYQPITEAMVELQKFVSYSVSI